MITTERKILEVSALLALFSEDEINTVIQRGQRTSDDRWWWGDKVKMWRYLIEREGIECDIALIYKSLSVLSGLSERSLAYYYRTANAFDIEIREKYHMLPFAHFSSAVRYGERQDEVLQKSLEHFTLYGRFLSAEALEWLFSPSAQETVEMSDQAMQAADELRGKARSLRGLGDDVSAPVSAEPHATNYASRRVIAHFQSSIGVVQKTLPLLPLSADSKARIQAALDQLVAACTDALYELTSDTQRDIM